MTAWAPASEVLGPSEPSGPPPPVAVQKPKVAPPAAVIRTAQSKAGLQRTADARIPLVGEMKNPEPAEGIRAAQPKIWPQWMPDARITLAVGALGFALIGIVAMIDSRPAGDEGVNASIIAETPVKADDEQLGRPAEVIAAQPKPQTPSENPDAKTVRLKPASRQRNVLLFLDLPEPDSSSSIVSGQRASTARLDLEGLTVTKLAFRTENADVKSTPADNGGLSVGVRESVLSETVPLGRFNVKAGEIHFEWEKSALGSNQQRERDKLARMPSQDHHERGRALRTAPTRSARDTKAAATLR